MPRLLLPVLVAAALAGGCRCVPAARGGGPVGPEVAPVARGAAPVGRSRAELEAAFEREKQRTPFLPMLSDDAAHEAMPTYFKGRPMPTLMRVAALQPKMMDAVFGVAKAMRTEGPLDNRFLNDVFWAVSSANDCFY